MIDPDELERRADPRYAGGELVRVTGARNEAEAEMIQNLLLEAGIPSLLRRTRGFDVPGFLAAGPRDVMVPSNGYEAAREVLGGTDMLTVEPPPDSLPGVGSPGRLAAWLGAAALVAFVLAWLVSRAVG